METEEKKIKRRKRGGGKLKAGVIAVLAVAAAGLIWTRIGGGADAPQQADPMTITRDSLAQVSRGPIRITTEGSGQLEAAQKTRVDSDWKVRIDRTVAEAGDLIKKGDVIAQMEEDSIDERIEELETQLAQADQELSGAEKSGSSALNVPVSGRVKRIFVKSGDVLSRVTQEKGGVMELSADGQMKLSFHSASDYAVGMKVLVRRDGNESKGYISDKDGEDYTVLFTDGEAFPVEEQAQIFDQDETLLGSGQMQIGSSYLVTADYGTVDSISVKVNQFVDRGAQLLSRADVNASADYISLLDKREETADALLRMRERKADPYIYAQEDGILSELLLQDGAAIEEDQAMYTLISTDRYYLKAAVDELEIAGVQQGQAASVVFDAFNEEKYEGTVEKVSALGSNTGGVTSYTVTIAMDGAPELKTAMSGTATIVTQEKENALLIPVDALQMKDGQRIVTRVKQDEQGRQQREDVPVTLGLVNHTMAEVTEGLAEGDTVVVIGTSQLEEMIGMMRAGRQSEERAEAQAEGSGAAQPGGAGE